MQHKSEYRFLRGRKKRMSKCITNNLKKGFKVDLVSSALLAYLFSWPQRVGHNDALFSLQAGYVDIPDHAKWKYLISTDGFTASCRWGMQGGPSITNCQQQAAADTITLNGIIAVQVWQASPNEQHRAERGIPLDRILLPIRPCGETLLRIQSGQHYPGS